MKALKSKKGIVKYIIAFSIPVLCMLVHMICRDCYPFGNNTVLLGDANVQYYWFEEMLLDKIKNGESILFSWQAGLGFEFYQNFFYYLASPFNIIAMIIGNWDMELGIVVTMLVQIGMCSVTMLYYLTHTARNKKNGSVVCTLLCIAFSLAYGMGNYMLAYQYNYIWLISLMLAPIVMLGVERLVWEGYVHLYIVSLTLVFITNFYFAWFICILSFAWYIDCLRGSKREMLSATGSFFASSFISALISAFTLVPCFLAIFGQTDRSTQNASVRVDFWGYWGDFIQSFLWGIPVDQIGSGYFTYNNYVGIAVLTTTMFFFTNRSINKYARIKRLIILSILSVALNWEVGSYIFHGFTLPNSYSNRFAFILSVFIIITAFEEMVNWDRCKLKGLIAVIIASVLFVLYALMGSNYIASTGSYFVTILLSAYCIICFILCNKKSIGEYALIVNIAVVCMCELVCNAFIVSDTSKCISQKDIRGTYAWIDEYNSFDLSPGDRKSSWVTSQHGMGNSDASMFSSVISKDVIELYKRLGMSYQANSRSYTYMGTTPVVDMMFNVRYVLTDHDINFGGYEADYYNSFYNKYIERNMTYGIYENKYVVGAGYVTSSDMSKWQLNGVNPFYTQNSYINNAFGIDGVFEEINCTDVTISAVGCDIVDIKGLAVQYKNNIENSSMGRASNTYEFYSPEDMYMYIYVNDDVGMSCNISIDDKTLGSGGTYISAAEMIDVGTVKKGQKITVYVLNNSISGYTSTTHISIMKYNEDNMQKARSLASENTYNITEWKSSKVKGVINSNKDGLLYTSIPYYKGMSVYVDGGKEQIQKLGGALCGVRITKGEHVVEFRYFPYGLKLGIALSILGIFFMALYVREINKHINTRQNSKGE